MGPKLLSVLLYLGCVPPTAFLDLSEPQDPVQEPANPVAIPEVIEVAYVGEINDEGVDAAASLLIRAESEHLKHVWLVFDSPGGSVRTGYQFLAVMQAAQRGGTRVVCEIPKNSMAASMAAFLFVHCDDRLMAKGAALMFHTVSTSDQAGNQWDYERLAKYMRSLNKRLAISIVGNLKITLREYEANVEDNDWWVDQTEAVEIGAATLAI